MSAARKEFVILRSIPETTHWLGWLPCDVYFSYEWNAYWYRMDMWCTWWQNDFRQTQEPLPKTGLNRCFQLFMHMFRQRFTIYISSTPGQGESEEQNLETLITGEADGSAMLHDTCALHVSWTFNRFLPTIFHSLEENCPTESSLAST